MVATDPRLALLPVSAELPLRDCKPRIHADLWRWIPPVSGLAPAPEASPADRAADRGRNGRLCHPLIVAFRSRERMSSDGSTISRRCHPDIVAFRSRERISGDRGTISRRCFRPGKRRGRPSPARARLTGNPASNRVIRPSKSAIPVAAIMFGNFGPAHGSQPGAQAGRHALEGREDLGSVGIAHLSGPRPSEMADITHLQTLADQGAVQNGAFWH